MDLTIVFVWKPSVTGQDFELLLPHDFSHLSLGCGIGYGYLHRIPTLPFVEGKKFSFPAATPEEPPSPKDGFTEVTQNKHLHPKTNILFDIILVPHVVSMS